MKKRVLLLVALATLLSVGVYGASRTAPVAQAQSHRPVAVAHSTGPNAQATFISTSADGTVQYVGVNASMGSLQMPPGKPVKGSSVAIVIVEGNEQTGSISFLADGQADVPGLSIDGKHLTGATLPLTTVTMNVLDPNTGNPTGQTFPVQVAVSWTGTGDITSDHGTSHFRIAGLMETSHNSGMFRNATAVADTLTYTLPNGTFVSFTGATDEFASLGNFRFMDILIIH